MNVSAKYFFGSGSSNPRLGGLDILVSKYFLLAFDFAKVFGLWLILLIASFWGVVESLQRRV